MNEMYSIISIAGMVTTIGTAIYTVQKIARGAKKDREEHEAKILQAAKEEDSTLRSEMNAKIKAQKVEIDNLKENFDKDIAHLRETHEGQIANLGEKIENLRDELRGQHAGIIGLLSKLVDKN